LTAPPSPVIVRTSVRCPICKSNSAMRDKRKAFEAILENFQKILPHLGNENDGEALNALRSLTALLKKAGLDWHDLVTLLHGSEDSFLEMLMRLMEKEADALVRLARAGATLFFSTKRWRLRTSGSGIMF
jgi:hypothetical protein